MERPRVGKTELAPVLEFAQRKAVACLLIMFSPQASWARRQMAATLIEV
jgi:hypothetical protein